VRDDQGGEVIASGRRGGGERTGGCLLVVGWAVGWHLGRLLAVDRSSILCRHVHGRSPCGVCQLIRFILQQHICCLAFEALIRHSLTSLAQASLCSEPTLKENFHPLSFPISYIPLELQVQWNPKNPRSPVASHLKTILKAKLNHRLVS
jgi:hypothetical protein